MSDKTLHNYEVEQSLLGALILDNSNVDEIPTTFQSRYFAAELHQTIYDVINKIRNEGSIADPITITNRLKNDEQFNKSGGQQYLIDLVDTVIGVYNTAEYARIIQDLYLRRQVVEISEQSINEARTLANTENGQDVIEYAEKQLYELSDELAGAGRLVAFREALSTSVENAAKAWQHKGSIIGVTSGFHYLDRILGGFQNSDLIILAGRPSMGKTALATGIALNAAKARLKNKSGGAGVVFFSLEMSSEQLATRILAIESGVPSDKIRRGEIPKEAFDKFAAISQELNDLDFYIEDTSSLSVTQIRNKARKLKRQKDIGLVVIDYLQLISASSGSKNRNENRVQEISEITRTLKSIAKELNVPVLALSQLSRAVEQRDDKKPQLSDLRESGSIEQDADVVMFVFREEYYKERKEPAKGSEAHDKWQTEIEAVKNKAEVIVAKQRQGPVGNIELYFDGSLTRFGDLMKSGTAFK